jgi:hypothetical protein
VGSEPVGGEEEDLDDDDDCVLGTPQPDSYMNNQKRQRFD